MYKPALVAGIIACELAVAIGAFGAHGLQKLAAQKTLESRYIATWETGATYQMYHGLALLAMGILYSAFPTPSLRWATILFIAGILLFSGSLYAIVGLAANGRSIGTGGVLTPIGGLCFICGWACALLAMLRK